LVIQAHAAEGYSFLQQHQKGNPIKSTLSFLRRRKEALFILYSAAEGSYACKAIL